VSANWLAIDTATDVASVAVRTDHRTVSRSIRGARQHAAQIVPLVHEVVGLAGLSLGQIEGILIGDGPGSFTGLRIGWAAAKGLIHGRRVPVFAIPSLLGAAYGAGVDTVAACYDALRGQVFGAVYTFGDEEVKTLVAPDVFTVSELVHRASGSGGPRPVLAVGDGAERYRAEILSWTGREPVGLDALPPNAGSMLALLEYDGARRAIIGDPSLAEPVYGRPAEAQVKWEARHGRALPNPPR
jgi:tRNA threonylcarbamoyladenosine biosynthesis protein TsaB